MILFRTVLFMSLIHMYILTHICPKHPTLNRKMVPKVDPPQFNGNSTLARLFSSMFSVATLSTDSKMPCYKWNCVGTKGKVCNWCFPYVFVGGFSKCGTTSFCSKLVAHPDIKPYRHKEMNLFAKIPEKLSLQSFERRILDNHENDTGKLMIDCTSGAYRDLGAVANLLHYSPSTKVIFLVRDPWQRMGSWLTMAKRSERKERFPKVMANWREMLSKDTPVSRKRFSERSIAHVTSLFPMNGFMYGEVLLHWKNAFRNNLLVLDHYDLEHFPNITMRRVEDFLQLPHYDFPVDVLLGTSVNTMIKVSSPVDSDNFTFVQNDTELARSKRRNVSKKGIKIRNLNNTDIHEPYVFEDNRLLSMTRNLFGPSLCLFEKIFGWSIRLITPSEVEYYADTKTQ